MANFREIVTKAVIGKAKKTSGGKHLVEPENAVNTVLGCWVINHNFSGSNNSGNVLINGAFDVNVWYSYDDDTKTAVATKRFNYTEKMNVPLRGDAVLDNSSEIIVRVLKQPTVSNVEVKNGQFELLIEKEMGVEIVGNTKVKVSVEEIDEVYIELVDEEIIDEIDNLNADYLDDASER